MYFEDVLPHLRKGAKIRRSNWKYGPDTPSWIQRQVPDANSKMNVPYFLAVRHPHGLQRDPESGEEAPTLTYPYTFTTEDIEAGNWTIVRED